MLHVKECHLLHALLEEGQTPCLTDDQIGPLHNDDGNEETGVASVFKPLALGISLYGGKESRNGCFG